jgi:DNA helicase HerA-like ATPase
MNELDSFLGRGPMTPRARAARRLGLVVGGSLARGLEVKLDAEQAFIEELAVGRYVVVHGAGGRRFFGLVTDIALGNADPQITAMPPELDDEFLREVLLGTTAFGQLHVSPMLVLEPGAEEAQPVKTVPGHFTAVHEADEQDVADVFSPPREAGRVAHYFHIGEPLDMPGVKVHINLERFVERSSGVFGKSGTGKTFLTRLLLGGIVRQNVAVNLVFDMHNEYGWKSQDEHRHEVKGLRQLFPGGQVSVVTLDPESSQRRESKVDFAVQIGYDQIEPEDVEMLAGLLDLTDVQVGALYAIHRRLGRHWIRELLDYEPGAPAPAAPDGADPHGSAPHGSAPHGSAPHGTLDESDLLGGPPELHPLARLVANSQLHEGTLGAIQRKLGILRRFGFLKPQVRENAVERIMEHLQRGTSVVLEFGRYGDNLEAYLLVANFLTRRIHEAYKTRKEAALGRQAEEPRPLVIVIEEAHKFLATEIARHTIFGTIARELRKYNVTLLVVDQRPSGIDDEVMSQIGTRVTCLLDNEADVRAVFSGVAGAQALRDVLARLDTRQQTLVLGHAVPMPVVVRTRAYDQEFYAAMGLLEGEALQAGLRRGVELLRGEDDGLV